MPVPCEETDEVFARVARVRRIEPGPYEVRILCDGKTRFRETALVGFDSITPVEVVIRR